MDTTKTGYLSGPGLCSERMDMVDSPYVVYKVCHSWKACTTRRFGAWKDAKTLERHLGCGRTRIVVCYIVRQATGKVLKAKRRH